MPRLWIQEISFGDGTIVIFEKSDVVLLVGPNNAGKSAALRGMREKIADRAAKPVISSLVCGREGSEQEVAEWLDTFTRKQDPSSENPMYQGLGAGVHRSHIGQWWDKPPETLHGLTRFFCHLLTAQERLQAADPPANIPILTAPWVHPIHYLIDDDVLEQRLSDHFRAAFGVDLIVNRCAGGQVPLHVGQRPPRVGNEDRLSRAYVEKLEELPMLHMQGDGMRSFAGVLLYTSVGRESILLIDEPEAFLHPPQARQLGRMLVADKLEERQLFVATHSGDVLRGVLDAGKSNVRVIRIRREGDVNHVRQIASAAVAELWNDPLLRYSNILDGLFHEKVILCEGDADARFYSAVLDALVEARGPGARRPDVMFTHCGGKDRCAIVLRALRAVDVPIHVVVDFDVLSAEKPLRDIVEAAGGAWNLVESDWTQVKSAIDSKKPDFNASEIKLKIQNELTQVADTTGLFPVNARKAINLLFKRSTPWATVKTAGKSAVPSGQPMQAFEKLVVTLRGYGIYIVEIGELEGFVRTVGNHGPKWVNEVLKKDLKSDPELDVARRFVSKLVELSQPLETIVLGDAAGAGNGG